ncbi:glucose-1-phosphate adenylyltransferase [Bacillus fonticola]|uniref:glucose-1-phosphate adenylyltransferase n=1 Tax=Bacillus fonticola TaxID=2728853 RepID=UPI001474088A|nr:glucose-1-phosphate adenylyltransferase [Bacillus fonticola]
MKKRCVAIILAGGKGSRLHDLTKELAKPAVPFGGKYRIIDFTLSNCTNSHIDTVGICTQYQPLVLHSYIGIGSDWDLDRRNGGVTVLPPYSESSAMKWYSGTANAIYHNVPYIEQYDPEYVLVLSGDHIYKMDYNDMLEAHIESGADATISVVEVPWEEANRFGIMNTDESKRIVEFEEKPKTPKSNLASMGIYIFNWKLLKATLQRDEQIDTSSHDFGKDVIPYLLQSGKKLMAYGFQGYWKDVGTVQSLWEANMDLLDPACELKLFDQGWRIYSVNPNHPPQMITSTACVEQSLVNEGCIVEGHVESSVLFQGVTVQKGAVVQKVVAMPNVQIEAGATVEYAIIDAGVTIPADVIIQGTEKECALVTKDSIQNWLHKEEENPWTINF